ncbi:MAG: hypothetical protein HOC23_08415 [Halieaceae bacterium]|jgi:hypothetical protein|nr:hypothetical protein [Halieaceae bacterium]
MRWCRLALLLVPCIAQAQILDFKSGHGKGQYQLGSYPQDSLLRDFVDTPTHDINADVRLLVGGRNSNWDWQADYQFIVRSGDTLDLSRQLAGSFLVPGAALNDEHRLMDLTHVISENDDSILLHRLDRLHFGYTGDKTVVRVGRQAVSWGNGLIYNPVDFFNPFDPAAVDKEYKTGDDMVYGQYLQDNGNDWQFVSVWRRDDQRNTSRDVNTNALKYHAFVGEQELDVLLAQHYDDQIITAGGITSWGGAIVRGDVVFTHTDSDDYLSAVANLTYSWVWGGKNVSGLVEYFYNGMGLREDDYSKLIGNFYSEPGNEKDLLSRLERGELFTIGRHYLAGGLTIEITPLIILSPTVFINMGDGSALAQVVGQYDFKQNWQFLLALNLPVGSDGTEFGGLDTGFENKQFSIGPSLFAQLAFYF